MRLTSLDEQEAESLADRLPESLLFAGVLVEALHYVGRFDAVDQISRCCMRM